MRKGLRSLCGACVRRPPSPSRDLFYYGRAKTGDRERERSTGEGDGKGQREATENGEGDRVRDAKQRCFSLTQAETANRRRPNHAFSLRNPWITLSGFQLDKEKFSISFLDRKK